jgi:hypothetical protein
LFFFLFLVSGFFSSTTFSTFLLAEVDATLAGEVLVFSTFCLVAEQIAFLKSQGLAVFDGEDEEEDFDLEEISDMEGLEIESESEDEAPPAKRQKVEKTSTSPANVASTSANKKVEKVVEEKKPETKNKKKNKKNKN